jgi:MtN3 and saliva related transmembrane protein
MLAARSWTKNILSAARQTEIPRRVTDKMTETIYENDSYMRLTTLLGFVAGMLTTISFVPQVLHAWRSKRCDDLSWAMLLTFSAGVVFWLLYGIRLWAMPVIVANAVTLALLLIIMGLKARYTAR